MFGYAIVCLRGGGGRNGWLCIYFISCLILRKLSKSVEQNRKIGGHRLVFTVFVSCCRATNIVRSSATIPINIAPLQIAERGRREEAGIFVYGIIISVVIVLAGSDLIMLPRA